MIDWGKPDSAYAYKQPVAKPEKVTPLETINALVEAAEKVQDKFDACPELRDLYYDGYCIMLDKIVENKS